MIRTRIRRGIEVEIPPHWVNRIPTSRTLRARKQMRLARKLADKRATRQFIADFMTHDDIESSGHIIQTSTKRAVTYTYSAILFR